MSHTITAGVSGIGEAREAGHHQKYGHRKAGAPERGLISDNALSQGSYCTQRSCHVSLEASTSLKVATAGPSMVSGSYDNEWEFWENTMASRKGRGRLFKVTCPIKSKRKSD